MKNSPFETRCFSLFYHGFLSLSMCECAEKTVLEGGKSGRGSFGFKVRVNSRNREQVQPRFGKSVSSKKKRVRREDGRTARAEKFRI